MQEQVISLYEQMMYEKDNIDDAPRVPVNDYNYFNYDPNDVVVEISSIAMQFEHKIKQ